MKCDSQASLLAHTFASPCLGREFKAKVVTMMMSLWRAMEFQMCKRRVKKSLLTSPQIKLVKIFVCEGIKLEDSPNYIFYGLMKIWSNSDHSKVHILHLTKDYMG
jgi:hypothetical protein